MTLSHPRILRSNGNDEGSIPANEHYYTLEELQAIVGGYIQMVDLADGRVMVLNEEGKLKDLPYNWQATNLFNAGVRVWFVPIAGDVLVCDERWLNPPDDDDDEPDGDSYFGA